MKKKALLMLAVTATMFIGMAVLEDENVLSFRKTVRGQSNVIEFLSADEMNSVYGGCGQICLSGLVPFTCYRTDPTQWYCQYPLCGSESILCEDDSKQCEGIDLDLECNSSGKSCFSDGTKTVCTQAGGGLEQCYVFSNGYFSCDGYTKPWCE